MSGIYLIVWENTPVRLLKATKGGYPHITVAYTGKRLTLDELKGPAKRIFDENVMKPVTLCNAYVNSFTVEKTGKERHDVLLDLSADDKKMVEEARDVLRNKFPKRHENFSMHNPHVTAKIFETREEAEEYAALINSDLPLPVTITGVTID
jgi:hypothetical protein